MFSHVLRASGPSIGWTELIGVRPGDLAIPLGWLSHLQRSFGVAVEDADATLGFQLEGPVADAGRPRRTRAKAARVGRRIVRVRSGVVLSPTSTCSEAHTDMPTAAKKNRKRYGAGGSGWVMPRLACVPRFMMGLGWRTGCTVNRGGK